MAKFLACSKRDVRRQGRHVRIGDRIDYHRAIGRRKRASQAAPDCVRSLDLDALETQQLGVVARRGIRERPARPRIGVALHGALLPGDLVEVPVVEHAERPAAGRDHSLQYLAMVMSPLMPSHLHRAVADERDRRPVGIGELGGDGVGHPGPHGGQVARQRCLHAAADFDVAGEPVGRRAGVGGEDGVVGQARGELPEEPLRVDGSAVAHRAVLEHLPPAATPSSIFSPPAAVLLLSSRGMSASQGGAGVADEVRPPSGSGSTSILRRRCRSARRAPVLPSGRNSE